VPAGRQGEGYHPLLKDVPLGHFSKNPESHPSVFLKGTELKKRNLFEDFSNCTLIKKPRNASSLVRKKSVF